jgi:hypothetical protein
MNFYLERLDRKGGGRIGLPEGTVSIGRNPKSAVALPADDRCVSGFHTVIYVDPSRLLLQDMQSTNGTFVNGRQVQECVLEAGDEIGLGRSGPRFRVGRDGAEESTPAGGMDDAVYSDFGVDIDDDIDVGEDIGEDVSEDACDEGNDIDLNTKSKPAAATRRSHAIGIAAAAAVIIGFLALTLIPLTRQPADRQKSSPAPKDFFSSPAEESSAPTPPSTPASTPATPATTTAGRINAILIRFGEDNYRAPPEMVERVEHYLNQYTGRMRRTIAGYMERKKRFFPMIRRVFMEKNIPLELAYVSMLESGFNTTAKSHAGAVGLWQFMPATARRYGLEVSSRTDERTDPEKATHAAAAYFKDLIAVFGARSSVMLCMAAYNAGETRIINALKRIDDPVRNRDFWYLYRMGWLAEETNEYIPQIIALMIISENLAEFGFEE